MRWALLTLAAVVMLSAGVLTDHFTSPPVEVTVIRTDQWLFCRDYGVTITIKAMDQVSISRVEVVAKFFTEGTLVPQIQKREFGGFTLQKGASRQISVLFNYCPQRVVDPLILLELFIHLPNYTISYKYYIGRVLPTTYEELERRAAALEARVKELEGLVAQLRRQISDLQTQLRSREAQVANLTSLLTVSRLESERLAAALAQLQAERDSLRSRLEQTQSELNAVSQARSALEAQLSETRRQLEQLSSRYVEAERTIGELQN
ncbi:MAG: hypothetical protein QW680_11975, partial [Pyrobaculum sp.]